MPDGFEIDTREFDRALVLYAEATKKDASYILNRCALNTTIKTAQLTPLADKAAIASLPKRKPWWPKFIAKRLGKGYTRKQARAASVKEIQRRQRARGSVRSGWKPAMFILNTLKAIAKGRPPARIEGVNRFKHPKGYGIAAHPGVYVHAEIANQQKGAGEHPEFLQQGLDAAAKDMTDFALKLMSETAAEHSAK